MSKLRSRAPTGAQRRVDAGLGDLSVLARAFVGRLVTDGPELSLHDVDGETQEFLYDGLVEGLRLIVVRPRPAPVRAALVLSPRESEIARMVAKGYPNKTIAAVLDISLWTVGTYLRRTFAKLGVGTRAAMVARLIESGLLAEQAVVRARNAD